MAFAAKRNAIARADIATGMGKLPFRCGSAAVARDHLQARLTVWPPPSVPMGRIVRNVTIRT